MAATIKAIIQDCVQEALGLPRDPIATDIRDLALSAVNTRGRIVWDAWPWDNSKVDAFTVVASGTHGILQMPVTVDVVRAVRLAGDDGYRLYPQDEILAAANGSDIEGERFQYVTDFEGCRRIMLGAEAAGKTYSVLALSRWVDATVEEDYDPDEPADTPTDYRVMTFAIDRAEPALREFVKDALRAWAGDAPQGAGSDLLALAKNRETKQQDREIRVNPRCPMFEEVGSW